MKLCNAGQRRIKWYFCLLRSKIKTLFVQNLLCISQRFGKFVKNHQPALIVTLVLYERKCLFVIPFFPITTLLPLLCVTEKICCEISNELTELSNKCDRGAPAHFMMIGYQLPLLNTTLSTLTVSVILKSFFHLISVSSSFFIFHWSRDHSEWNYSLPL